MKILIADDEELARDRLKRLLADLPGVELAGEARNGREAVEKVQSVGADLVLLDIRMPVMDGLEAARYLAELEPAPAVVFCTAYDQHALAAFEARAVDYLVKPVRRERLVQALDKARRHTGEIFRALAGQTQAPASTSQGRTHVCARVRGNLVLVPVADVLYFLAEDKYVVVHHRGGEVLIEEALKGLEEEFPERFVRIHRNCLVAREQIGGLVRAPGGQIHVEMKDIGTTLEVSRRSLPGLRKLVKAL